MPQCKDAVINASISFPFQLSLLWVTLMFAPWYSVLLVYKRVRMRVSFPNTHLPPKLMGSDRSACKMQIFLRASCHLQKLWEGSPFNMNQVFLGLQYLLYNCPQGNASHPAWDMLHSPTPPKWLRFSTLVSSSSFLRISLFVRVYISFWLFIGSVLD